MTLTGLLALLCYAASVQLEQYTPDLADWSTFYNKASHLTDHSPDGVDWLDTSDWPKWDGTTIYNPEEYSREEFYKLLCPTGDKVRGVKELFDTKQPFADLKNPTKAEVDEWHRVVLNHIRAMVGYTGDEYEAEPDKCLHLRALWSDERHRTRMWDAKYPEDTCENSTDPHCGASFVPSVEEQKPYLPDDISSCVKSPGSEGIFSAAKSNIPWSIKWSRPFCSTLDKEGFWGGHTGPWFHRKYFGWNWYDDEKDNANSNAILRAKWNGPNGTRLYTDPDISSGRFLVYGQHPRYPGYQCAGIKWTGEAESASACYDRMLSDDSCGKRYMTYNDVNFGCACYPVDMETCVQELIPSRLTWDFEPVPSSIGGYVIPDTTLFIQQSQCQDIIWKYSAGDAWDCLEKIVTDNDPACGRKYLTWNANGGGCGCYAPEQTTCERDVESGRMTYELEFDPSYNDEPSCGNGIVESGEQCDDPDAYLDSCNEECKSCSRCKGKMKLLTLDIGKNDNVQLFWLKRGKKNVLNRFQVKPKPKSLFDDKVTFKILKKHKYMALLWGEDNLVFLKPVCPKTKRSPLDNADYEFDDDEDADYEFDDDEDDDDLDWSSLFEDDGASVGKRYQSKLDTLKWKKMIKLAVPMSSDGAGCSLCSPWTKNCTTILSGTSAGGKLCTGCLSGALGLGAMMDGTSDTSDSGGSPLVYAALIGSGVFAFIVVGVVVIRQNRQQASTLYGEQKIPQDSAIHLNQATGTSLAGGAALSQSQASFNDPNRKLDPNVY